MKKVKFIPVLMIAMLIASCGITPLKEPDFSKYKNQVDFDTVSANFTAACNENEFEGEPKEWPNKRSTFSEYQKIDASLRRKKKELGSSHYVGKVSSVRRYDIKNYLAEETTKYEYTNEARYPNFTSDLKSEDNVNLSYQYFDEENSSKLLLLNNRDKYYYCVNDSVNPDSKHLPIASMAANAYLGEMVVNFDVILNSYGNLETTKLYSDDKTFTIVININEMDLVVANADYSLTIQEKTKVQISLVDGEEKFALSKKKVEVYQYFRNSSLTPPGTSSHTPVLAGDKCTIEYLQYIEATMNTDDFSLKEKDITSYIDADAEAENDTEQQS